MFPCSWFIYSILNFPIIIHDHHLLHTELSAISARSSPQAELHLRTRSLPPTTGVWAAVLCQCVGDTCGPVGWCVVGIWLVSIHQPGARSDTQVTKASLLQHAPVSLLYGAGLLFGTKGGIRMRKLGLEFRMCSQALMVRVASTPMTSCQYHLQPIHPSRQDGIWEVTVTLIDIGVLPGLVFGDTWAGGRREGKGGGICTGANCERFLQSILGFGSIKAMSISRSLNAKKRSLQALEDTHEDTFTRTLSQATSRATSQYHGLEESGRICFSFQQFQFLSISRKGIPS